MLLHRGDSLQGTAHRLALSRGHVRPGRHVGLHQGLLSLQAGKLCFLLRLLKLQLIFQIQLAMLNVAALRQPPGVLEGRIILRQRKGVHIEFPEPHAVFPEFRFQHAEQGLADVIQVLIQRKGVHMLQLQDTPQEGLDLCVQHTVELVAQALRRQFLPRAHKPDQHLLYLVRIRLYIHGSAGAHIQGHGLARLHLQHHIHPLAGSPWQRHLHGQVYEIHLRMKISSESQLRKKAQKREIPRLQHMHSRAQHLYELSVPEEHRHLGFMHVEPGSKLKILGRAFPRQDVGASFVYYHRSHTLPPPPLLRGRRPSAPCLPEPIRTYIQLSHFIVFPPSSHSCKL